jgi:acyl dehydratase
MTSSIDLQAMVGQSFRLEDYYEVGREKVREFARAVQDYHPVHWSDDAAQEFGYSGLVAPLTFVSLLGNIAQRELGNRLLSGYDLSQILQTDQVLEFRRPVVAGDRLNCEVFLDSFRQAFGGDLIGIRNVVTDYFGAPVLTSRTSVVGRSGGRDDRIAAAVGRVLMHGITPGSIAAPVTRPSGNRAPAPRAVPVRGVAGHARRFETVSVGDELPPRVVQVTQGDLVNYAGVSGDPNPIHWNDELAGLVHLDSTVAHGMLTIGLCAGFLTSWLGDPGAVREYSVRLTSPVFVAVDAPGEIEYTGRVKSLDPIDRTAAVTVSGLHRGKKIFGRATATVQLS